VLLEGTNQASTAQLRLAEMEVRSKNNSTDSILRRQSTLSDGGDQMAQRLDVSRTGSELQRTINGAVPTGDQPIKVSIFQVLDHNAKGLPPGHGHGTYSI
jgi:hypothetical protein